MIMLSTDKAHIPLKCKYLLLSPFGSAHAVAVYSKSMAAMKFHSLYVI